MQGPETISPIVSDTTGACQRKGRKGSASVWRIVACRSCERQSFTEQRGDKFTHFQIAVFLASSFLSALLGGAVAAEPPAGPQPWPFDIILLRNGAVLKGLILDSTEQKIKFQQVHRHPGRATVSIPTVIDRGEIDRIERLPAEQRAILQ